GIPQISTGNILREAAAQGTPLGLKADGYMKRGELVPDDLIIGLIDRRLREDDCERGFLLDGFPRTMPQAQALDGILEMMERPLNLVVALEVSADTVVERNSLRRCCLNCGATYHLKNHPPRRAGICDQCGRELIHREDDREEVIRRRLQVYDSQTQPLIHYYRANGLVRSINGELPVDEVTAILARMVEEGTRE
ncbi:MAG: nucleoside monophosphate kinase, partial [Armatimonadetes bacterium]|nr:nucleoside monophosphate kinase [Armatimonadota bacterium]